MKKLKQQYRSHAKAQGDYLSISLSDTEYEKLVTALNSAPDLAALEGIKKLFKRKAPWE
ncbi:hypothetical protein [Photobacterium aquimaris]|uniref:Uncharacterized protein n=1 Tax=Photobacterium aquimaris TaxID=512643 RepID=A0A1Y6L4G8_9GAMM|nr:hypothetical protein [Photobacterium aquimaris]SMY17478.1 hypothetical protein PAQU9191_02785 [Photobacterium aquimaris]